MSQNHLQSVQTVDRVGFFFQDIAFACYYVIVFSFIRQSLVIYFLRPLARYFGIRKDAKIERFTEQGYAILYFSCTGTVGLV